jgi:hypothetical protein
MCVCGIKGNEGGDQRGLEKRAVDLQQGAGVEGAHILAQRVFTHILLSYVLQYCINTVYFFQCR